MEFNGTFLATIITFILFVIIMNKILYAPILDIMEKRANLIDSNYKNAKDNDLKADELNKERDEKLEAAKDDARGKYLSVIDDFKQQKSEILDDAQNKAREEIEKSETELAEISNEVKNGLKNSMNDLANDIVEKIIGYRSDIENFDGSKVDEVLYR